MGEKAKWTVGTRESGCAGPTSRMKSNLFSTMYIIETAKRQCITNKEMRFAQGLFR